MIVLVCGGRDYTNKKVVYDFLDKLHETFPISLLVAGLARGADTLAMDWAIENDVPFKGYKANWHKYGNGAGPVRNQLMLEDSNAELVIAFPGGTGTYDMIKRAKMKPGVELTVIRDVDTECT